MADAFAPTAMAARAAKSGARAAHDGRMDSRASQSDTGTSPTPEQRHTARSVRRIRLGGTETRSANAVTIASLGFAAGAGILLSVGNFVWAALAMIIACLGDALDGLVARRSASASVGGALLDASVDRYEEFLFLGGLALYLRCLGLGASVADHERLRRSCSR
jgi:hypothetical protein